MNKPLPVLGLVGGIGSGKSFIAHLFSLHGAIVLDADGYGHDALKQPEIKTKISDIWGEAVFDADTSEVNRKALGKIVFACSTAKSKLEALVFPYIETRIRTTLAAAEKMEAIPLAILDAAIMLETGWHTQCQAVVFVDAPLEVRLQRVAKRGWDAAELKRREAAQWPLEKKKALCQFVIENSGKEVAAEVAKLFEKFKR